MDTTRKKALGGLLGFCFLAALSSCGETDKIELIKSTHSSSPLLSPEAGPTPESPAPFPTTRPDSTPIDDPFLRAIQAEGLESSEISTVTDGWSSHVFSPIQGLGPNTFAFFYQRSESNSDADTVIFLSKGPMSQFSDGAVGLRCFGQNFEVRNGSSYDSMNLPCRRDEVYRIEFTAYVASRSFDLTISSRTETSARLALRFRNESYSKLDTFNIRAGSGGSKQYQGDRYAGAIINASAYALAGGQEETPGTFTTPTPAPTPAPTPPPIAGSVQMKSTITRHDITWTFDKAYPVSQYINGDWAVIDDGKGVVIKAVNPMPNGSSNGSGINIPGNRQPADGRANLFRQGVESFPVRMVAGDSMVSFISLKKSDSNCNQGTKLGYKNIMGYCGRLLEHTYVKGASVITVVSKAPTSFARPHWGLLATD